MSNQEELDRLKQLTSEITIQQIELIDLFRKLIDGAGPHEVQLAMAESLRSITYAAGLLDARISLLNSEKKLAEMRQELTQEVVLPSQPS